MIHITITNYSPEPLAVTQRAEKHPETGEVVPESHWLVGQGGPHTFITAGELVIASTEGAGHA